MTRSNASCHSIGFGQMRFIVNCAECFLSPCPPTARSLQSALPIAVGDSCPPFVQLLDVVRHGVPRSQQPETVMIGSNPEDLLVVTEQAGGLPTIERLLLAESAGLQLAFAVDGFFRPAVHVAKMKSVLASDARPLFVVPLHSSPLSGSTPSDVLPS